ncbi:MAG: hypothetical protein LBL08_03875 [Candidatus Nomurabacteria bacterium]|jgi:antitoxin (DNA-binding transcriptional repressor) of toxin-antitoxin stability system|nr:hypothetical protein [Candidatus Nomurabacteria bacterium]
MNNKKIITITVTDFRKNFDKCADMVRQGYEFTVVKHSAPICRVTKPDIEEWSEVLEQEEQSNKMSC